MVINSYIDIAIVEFSVHWDFGRKFGCVIFHFLYSV